MQKDDITLILVMPPQPGLLSGFATGLISIANFVQANLPSLPVQIYDLSAVSVAALREAILQQSLCFHRNTIVGITTTTASYQGALAVASAFKEMSLPGVKITTIFGGHHASADPETVLQNHQGIVDYVVVGEGEIAMVEFLRRFPDVHSTPGLAFIHDKPFSSNAPPRLLDEDHLDAIPLFFQDNGFRGSPGKFEHATYVSARGCPLQCAFCSVANQKIRARSVAQVAKDIRQLVKLGFSRIAIEDNFFAHTPQRTNAICAALAGLRRNGLDFTWDCQTRVESMDRQGLVRLMEEAGCEAVYLGVESLNPDQLLYLKKAPNPSRYLDCLMQKVVPALLNSEVACYINLQFGLPGETEAHHAETKNILREIGQAAAHRKKKITIFPQLHVVYPGTTHFQEGLRKRQFPGDIFESFTAWEAQQTPVLNWLGKHFAHGTGGIPVGILDEDTLRAGEFSNGPQNTVDAGAVMRIDTILTDLHELNGIEVFKYGKYLVREAIGTKPSPTVTLSERT